MFPWGKAMNNSIFSLECRNVKKYFGGVKAVDGTSLNIKKGEVRALFGGNGSGKSTLAKIIGGVVSLDSGEILINGKKVFIKSPRTADDLGIAITAQELSLFSNLSVEYNIMLDIIKKRSKLFFDSKEIIESADGILSRLDHLDIAKKNIEELPENKKYIIELAKALIRNPKLLIVDEITSALHLQEFEIVKNVILEYKNKGIPIIFISHRLNEIFGLCDSVTVMRNGIDILTDDLDNISRQELLDLVAGKKNINGTDFEYKKNETSIQERENNNALKNIDKKIVFSAKNIRIPFYKTELDIKAKRGEFIAISGLQGQGQSDFIRALFGLSGSVKVEIDENEINISSPLDAIKNGIGFISGNRESEGVFPERPIFENIDVVNNYVLKNQKANYKQISNKFQIKISDLSDPIKSLSGGNQQKTVIARWLIIKPKVLLADDPNKGVDVQARKDVHMIIKDLVESGSTVLMVSSDDEELADISNLIKNSKILIIYAGQIIKELTDYEISVPNIIHYSLSKPKGIE